MQEAERTLELVPEESLKRNNFIGYSESSDISKIRIELPVKVDRCIVEEYSECTVRSQSRFDHNHLIGDEFAQNDSVYFFDEEWKLRKCYHDPTRSHNAGIAGPVTMWTVPKTMTRKKGDYNLSLQFASPSIAVIGDGMGMMHILDTGTRSQHIPFSVIFSDEVAGPDQPFLIIDAVTRTNGKGFEEIHALLISTYREDYLAKLHWITFIKINGEWRQEAIRLAKTHTDFIWYAHFSTDCESIYVISNYEFYMYANSDFPVVPKEKIYRWMDNYEKIIVEIPLPENMEHERSEDMDCDFTPTSVRVIYKDHLLISGNFHAPIDTERTRWQVKENGMHLYIYKVDGTRKWPRFIIDNPHGVNVKNPSSTGQNIVKECTHVCCANKVNVVDNVQKNEFFAIFSETCTFHETSFKGPNLHEERSFGLRFYCLNGTTNEATHVTKLESREILLTTRIAPNLPAAFGTSTNNDIYIWQPTVNAEELSISHIGTLKITNNSQLIQQTRKYMGCPPNMSYTATYMIGDSKQALFIQNQSKLSERRQLLGPAGSEIQDIGVFYVVDCSGRSEGLGMYCSNTKIFVLKENSLAVINV